MNFQELKYKANYYALILLAFVIPLDRKFAPPLIIFLLLTSLINNRLKDLKNHKILLFSLLYVLYALGVFYSTNKADGVKELVEKLSLVIFPIAIYISKIDFKNKLSKILFSFVDGCLVAGVISIIVSIINYYFSTETSMFFYGNSSYFLHPSYMAMYASFSLLIVYASIFNNEKETKKEQIIKGVLLLLFTISIILSASKTGLISVILIHIGALTYLTIKQKIYLRGIGVFVTLIIGIFTIYNTSATIKKRINELITVAGTGNTSSHSTTAARAEIWKISTDLIKEKPLFGYGTGDVKAVLIEAYKKSGFTEFAKKKLNAHNQFLQTSIAIGLLGGVLLLLMFLIPLFYSINRRNYFYSFFILLVVLNLLTESMLERQAGIVFYAFFNCLLFIVYSDKNFKRLT